MTLSSITALCSPWQKIYITSVFDDGEPILLTDYIRGCPGVLDFTVSKISVIDGALLISLNAAPQFMAVLGANT